MARSITTYREPDCSKRQVTLISVDSLSELLPLPERPTKYYTMLLVMDGRPEINGDLGKIPEELLKEGLAYLCAWGPDCGRVHDIFDEVIVDLEIRTGNEYNPMTTWHQNQSLDETLWFFLNSLQPTEQYVDNCASALVVSVANVEWSKYLSGCLSNIESFNERTMK